MTNIIPTRHIIVVCILTILSCSHTGWSMEHADYKDAKSIDAAMLLKQFSENNPAEILAYADSVYDKAVLSDVMQSIKGM